MPLKWAFHRFALHTRHFCISAFTGVENGCGNIFPLLTQCISALNADFSVWHSCIFKLKTAFQMDCKPCFAGLQACITHIIHLCEIHCILCNGAIAYALIFGLFCGPIHLCKKCASHCVFDLFNEMLEWKVYCYSKRLKKKTKRFVLSIPYHLVFNTISYVNQH